MALRYDEWLARTGKRGTAADAALWKRTHGVALGLYNQDGSRRPPAPPPVPTFDDPRIPGLQAQLQAIPGSFNDQRRMAANDAVAAITSSGLADSATLVEEKSDSGIPGANGNQQNIVYRVVVGPGGRLYRQAYQQSISDSNSRGFLESSDTRDDVRQRRTALDARMNDVLRGVGDQQVRLLDDQRRATADVDDRIRGVKADRASDMQNDPSSYQPPRPAPPPSPAPSVSRPPAPAGAARPAAAPRTARVAPAPRPGATARLARRGARNPVQRPGVRRTH